MEGDIRDLFKITIDDVLNLGILLYNGDIFVLEAEKLVDHTILKSSQRKHKITGEIVKTQIDEISFKTFMIIYKQKNGEKDDAGEDKYNYKASVMIN